MAGSEIEKVSGPLTARSGAEGDVAVSMAAPAPASERPPAALLAAQPAAQA